MTVDQEELLFEHLIARTISLYIKNELWNQIYNIKLPSYLKYDSDKLDKTKKYMNKHLNPGLDLHLMENNNKLFFILNKTQMYNNSNAV